MALRTDEVIDVKIGTAAADDSLTSESIKLQGFDGKNDLLFSGAGEDLVDGASLSGFANIDAAELGRRATEHIVGVCQQCIGNLSGCSSRVLAP